jgi:uncharacterized membrane protein YqiK
MIIVVEVLFLALALLAVLALFFRVRCPAGHALVMTQRSKGALRSGPPAFRVVAGQAAFRTPSVGAVDLLDLSPVRVDAFVSLVDDLGGRHDLHAIARIRVSSRTNLLRKAAVRVLGMPRRDLDAIGEGALQLAVRDALAGRLDNLDHDLSGLESDVRDEFGAVLEELGMEIVELRVRMRKPES